MRLDSALKKKSSPIYLGPRNLHTILMHWMSVKLADNFQIRKHSWPCLFHIKVLEDESHFHLHCNSTNFNIWKRELYRIIRNGKKYMLTSSTLKLVENIWLFILQSLKLRTKDLWNVPLYLLIMYVVQIYLLFSYVSYTVRHSRHYDMVDRYGISMSQMTTDMFHLS